MQVYALVFQGPAQPLDEDIIEEPPLSVHRDRHAGSSQSVGLDGGSEPATLISIHYLGRAELKDGLVQRLDPDIGLQRVRDAPSQDLPGMPAHDSD